jgi:hypothetical protein
MFKKRRTLFGKEMEGAKRSSVSIGLPLSRYADLLDRPSCASDWITTSGRRTPSSTTPTTKAHSQKGGEDSPFRKNIALTVNERSLRIDLPTHLRRRLWAGSFTNPFLNLSTGPRAGFMESIGKSGGNNYGRRPKASLSAGQSPSHGRQLSTSSRFHADVPSPSGMRY